MWPQLTSASGLIKYLSFFMLLGIFITTVFMATEMGRTRQNVDILQQYTPDARQTAIPVTLVNGQVTVKIPVPAGYYPDCYAIQALNDVTFTPPTNSTTYFQFYAATTEDKLAIDNIANTADMLIVNDNGMDLYPESSTAGTVINKGAMDQWCQLDTNNWNFYSYSSDKSAFYISIVATTNSTNPSSTNLVAPDAPANFMLYFMFYANAWQ